MKLFSFDSLDVLASLRSIWADSADLRPVTMAVPAAIARWIRSASAFDLRFLEARFLAARRRLRSSRVSSASDLATPACIMPSRLVTNRSSPSSSTSTIDLWSDCPGLNTSSGLRIDASLTNAGVASSIMMAGTSTLKVTSSMAGSGLNWPWLSWSSLAQRLMNCFFAKSRMGCSLSSLAPRVWARYSSS